MSGLPVPGTVHLIDIEGTSNLQHGKNIKDVILHPQPTKDPNDPLNWSPRRKLNSTVWQMLWCFFSSMAINGLPPAYLLINEDTGISVGDLNTGNGLMYLFFAIGNFVAQPLAVNFGRRPAAFFAVFITAFFVLWASFMKTAGEWYANRILIGLSFAAIECLIELCIVDTKFVHERGFHMGFYTWTLFGSALFAPIPSGFIATGIGWRSINRIYAGIGLLTAIGTFFFFEETMFFRPEVDEFLDEAQAKAMDNEAHGSADEKQVDLSKHVRELSHTSEAEPGETYEVKTYWQRLKLWQARDPRQPNTFFKFFFLPLQLLRYPVIIFSGLLVGSCLAWFNIILGTTATIFGNPPYNFSANEIGLTYISCLIGISFGCALAGWANDRLANFMARRNNGVKEPEARLWIALVPMIIHPAGCVLYGVGAAHHIHWVGVCFGLGMVASSIVIGATLAFSYLVDCYKEIVGSSVITVVLIRNIIGFAFSYAISPMVDNLGLQGAFLLVAFVGMGLTGTCFVMIVVGKSLRRASSKSYWRLVEDHGFRAH